MSSNVNGTADESRPLIVGGGQNPVVGGVITPPPSSTTSVPLKSNLSTKNRETTEPVPSSGDKKIAFRPAAQQRVYAPSSKPMTNGEDSKNRFQVDKVSDKNANDDDWDDDDEREQLYGSSGAGYKTENLKSFRHYTREALPRMDHYRHLDSVTGYLARPTLDELHGTQATVSFDSNTGKITIAPVPEEVDPNKMVKFGWIKGVLVRCLLNIWGVMLFLRLSWVAAQAGIIHGTLILLLASLVTVVTTMSMSAICTNGIVKGGGTYYMISRSLGPEFGGSIGVIFSLANAVAVAMYSVGFAETVRDHLKQYGKMIFDGGLNDIRLVSSLTVVLMLGIVLIGTEWEAQTQVFLLFILLTAMTDFLIGACLPPNDIQISRGYFGWSSSLIWENMFPAYRNETFLSVFAVYFPAATGILAGANISGDLKDPSYSIPLGTFLAIIITTISYIGFHFIVAANCVRDANGVVELLHHPGVKDVYTAVRNCSLAPDGICHYGTMNNFQIIELMSWFGPIIYAGIYAATLSSALASMVSAPKVFQALCNDKLYPGIEYFGKGFGPNNEPRRGYFLTFLIGFGCCLMGELNLIAPIISNFFLAAYALINFSCFHASWSKSPGFRPSFKYYNLWLALLGALLCLMVMFMTAWFSALITFVIVFGLYIWVANRAPDVNWGSSTQAQTHRSAVNTVYRLTQLPEHVKTYRPQILLLSGNPPTRSDFVDLAYLMTKNVGLLICGHVITKPVSIRAQNVLIHDGNQYLIKRNMKAFFNLVQDKSFADGVKALIQCTGIGKLRPNIVMLGYKRNWREADPEEVLDYFRTIHIIFDYHLSIVVVHMPDRKAVANGQDAGKPTAPAALESDGKKSDTAVVPMAKEEGGETAEIPADSFFLSKQKKGYIDVWWLYDDGGLTLLLPYIIRTHAQWKDCKLRVFALVNKKSELDEEQRNMAALLAKFRIDYSDVILITDLTKPPSDFSVKEFRRLIEKYIISDDEEEDSKHDRDKKDGMHITETDLIRFKDKTYRHIRLAEILRNYSKESRLIVITLPMPRKNSCPAVLYMAWLETLTKNMPPMMLMRGNQTDVLTFYS